MVGADVEPAGGGEVQLSVAGSSYVREAVKRQSSCAQAVPFLACERPGTGCASGGPGRPAVLPRGFAVHADRDARGRGVSRTALAPGHVHVVLGQLQDADRIRIRDPGLPHGPGRVGDPGPGQPGRSVEVRRGDTAGHPGWAGDLADGAGARADGRGAEADADAGARVLDGRDRAFDLRLWVPRGGRAAAPEFDV